MMMQKDHYSNGHVRRLGQTLSPVSSSLQNRPKKFTGPSLSIPSQQKRCLRLQSANESDDSLDSSNGPLTPDLSSPVTAFSRSLSSSSGGMIPLNVYSMSPRTQVMYQYYSNPRGYYQNQVPLLRSRSNSGRYCTDEHVNARIRYRNFGRARTTSDCCHGGSPPKLTTSVALSGIPQTLQDDVIEDPRRRAWSESDSNRKNTMNMNRMSALKKLRKKLGRSGSLKKRKEETNNNDILTHSVPSASSLEKVEEGRQLDCSTTPNSAKRITMFEDSPDLSSLSIHQEDETIRDPGRLSPENTGCERMRSPSNESVFTHDGELIYQRFLEEHTCYDIMPTSCKLVVFDTRLQARKAFHALIENAVRSAPLWDSEAGSYVGMLTVADFIQVILTTHRMPDAQIESVEEQTIESWRELLGQKSSFASVNPGDSLYHSLNVLMNEHFNGVPILDQNSGDILHIVNHKRILRFLHLFMSELPKPSFMNKTLGEVKIGKFEDVATVTKKHTMLDVLELIVNKKVTAVPVVDEDDEVMDVFCKLDMIPLAAQGLYHDMSMTMETALACRFTPLFEDEECQADAYSRFSTPPPQRREFPTKPDATVPRSEQKTSLTAYLDEYNSRNETTSRSCHSSIRGHSVIRKKTEKSPDLKQDVENTEPSKVPPTPKQSHQPLAEPSAMPECTGQHRIRHKSLSNPLVKCQLSDKLQHIIDLMVTTDANLLVVVSQSSNHVIGSVTVSDVLYYIVNPQGYTLPESSMAQKKKGRHIFSSTSSGFASLSSVQDTPEGLSVLDDSEDPLDDGSGGIEDAPLPSKLSSSSDASGHTFNDSGYTSATMLNPLTGAPIERPGFGSGRSDSDALSCRLLPRGIEIERA